MIECRAKENIEKHYNLEKKLALKLKCSNKTERKKLYKKVYTELYNVIKDHPRWKKEKKNFLRRKEVQNQLNFLKNFLNSKSRFLELGPGDCLLSLEVSKVVKEVFVVDVSDIVIKGMEWPNNFSYCVYNGINLPKNIINIDYAYSHQVMEHLHPDDALDQLRDIYKSLKIGGKYICITPNRINGPHDISKFFDKTPSCFHLKEYTLSELNSIFKSAKFSKIKFYLCLNRNALTIKIPKFFIFFLETVLYLFPYYIRKKISYFPPIKKLLSCTVVAIN